MIRSERAVPHHRQYPRRVQNIKKLPCLIRTLAVESAVVFPDGPCRICKFAVIAKSVYARPFFQKRVHFRRRPAAGQFIPETSVLRILVLESVGPPLVSIPRQPRLFDCRAPAVVEFRRAFFEPAREPPGLFQFDECIFVFGVFADFNQVAQNRAGLYGRQLVLVAEQHQPAIPAQRREKRPHQYKIHHRAFVHYHQTVRQGIVLVVRPLRPVAAEKRMDGCAFNLPYGSA